MTDENENIENELNPKDSEELVEQPEPVVEEAVVENEPEPAPETPAPETPAKDEAGPITSAGGSVTDDQPPSGEGPITSAGLEADKGEAGHTPPIPLKPKEQTKKKYTPPQVPQTSAARKLTYIVLIQLLFMVVMGVMDVLFYLEAYDLKKEVKEKKTELGNKETKIQNLYKEIREQGEFINQQNNNITQLTGDKATLEKDLGDMTATKNDLSMAKSNLEKRLKDLQTDYNKQEQNLNETSSNLKNLETDYKKVVDEKAAVEKEKAEVKKALEELTKRYKDMEKAYLEISTANAISQEGFAAVYALYKEPASKMIDSLSAVSNTLGAGLTFKEFNDIVNGLDAPYQALVMSLNETSLNFLSFKLIKQAYDNYKESVERWKSLARLNPTGNGSAWVSKILKSEDPVTEERPWTDYLKYLWRESVLDINAGRALLEAQEVFSYDKCPLCDGKHSFTCIKCGGNGTCINCGGKSFYEIEGLTTPVPCRICEGSGRCSMCGGVKVLPCPLSRFTTVK